MLCYVSSSISTDLVGHLNGAHGVDHAHCIRLLINLLDASCCRVATCSGLDQLQRICTFSALLLLQLVSLTVRSKRVKHGQTWSNTANVWSKSSVQGTW
jgi:hypothetical protein